MVQQEVGAPGQQQIITSAHQTQAAQVAQARHHREEVDVGSGANDYPGAGAMEPPLLRSKPGGQGISDRV